MERCASSTAPTPALCWPPTRLVRVVVRNERMWGSVSDLILFKEQSHPGRCIVAYKGHISELVDLTDEERNAFFADVAKAAKAIHAAFHPDKVNYGAYGNAASSFSFGSQI